MKRSEELLRCLPIEEVDVDTEIGCMKMIDHLARAITLVLRSSPNDRGKMLTSYLQRLEDDQAFYFEKLKREWPLKP
jgi:hypothetical protein